MPFDKKTIEFSNTGIIPKITEDYISGKPQLLSFINEFPKLESIRNVVTQRKSFPVNRSILATVLAEQNKNSSEATLRSIELLKKENTYTVTTGQQLNLFTGPLYFIFKIISAIKLASALRDKYADLNFVPVYWMNGEDHDLEEINHTYIYGKKIEWKTNQKGATGRMSCAGMQEVIGEVEAILGKGDANAEVISILKSAYKESNTLSEATRSIVNSAFGKYGLITIDGDDARLKKEFSGILKDELINQNAFKKVNETARQLEGDYSIQVHPREINLFYLSKDSRERIVKEDSVWKVLNTSFQWNETDLLKEVNEHPERFSPNVVLRPLYQESILPNVAYIGGPSEIAYWLEYKSMFDYFKVSFPIPVLRNCAMIIDDTTALRLSKLKITEEQLFESADDLIKRYLHHADENGFTTDEETKQITSAYDELIRKIGETDASLIAPAEAEKKKNLNSLKVLADKVIRAQKKNHETEIHQIQKLKEKHFPFKSFQERIDNIIPYYIKYGKGLFDELTEHFDPLGKQFIILTERKQKT